MGAESGHMLPLDRVFQFARKQTVGAHAHHPFH